MSHRWDRNYSRAARPPPDIIQGAKDTLVAWVLLLAFCIMLGMVLMFFNVDTDH